MKAILRVCVAVGLVALWGCRSENSSNPNPPTEQAKPGIGGGSAETPTPVDPTPATTPTGPQADDVKRMVSAWVNVQNQQDFPKYAELYATKFLGVRRTGTETKKFARAGWLADRERMFGKKPVVSITNLTVKVSGTAAVAEFEQTWAAGTFKDVGPKRLVVIEEDGQLRIAREELLESNVLSSKSETQSLITAKLTRVHDLGGPTILIARNVDKSLGSGELRLLHKRGPIVAGKTVTDPGEFGAWKDRALRLYDDQGHSCAGKVTSFEVVAGVWPHFGYYLDENSDPKDTPDDDDRDMAWSDGGARLVGRITPESGCTGTPLFAVEDGTKVGDVFTSSKNGDGALAALAGERLRKLKEFAKLKKLGEPDGVVVTVWSGAGGDQIVSAWSFVETGECGDGTALQALWRVSGDKWTLLDAHNHLDVEWIVDIDGDGTLEFVGKHTYDHKGKPIGDNSLDFPSFDCPC